MHRRPAPEPPAGDHARNGLMLEMSWDQCAAETSYLLFAVAEDVLEVRIGFEHLLVEERCDGLAMFGKYRHSGCDELPLLGSELGRVGEVVSSLDDFAHGHEEWSNVARKIVRGRVGGGDLITLLQY